MKFICPLFVVRDVERSREFYENVLKQKVKHDFVQDIVFEGDFAIHLESHFKGVFIDDSHIITKRSNNFELYFEADRIDEVYLKLKMKGSTSFMKYSNSPGDKG